MHILMFWIKELQLYQMAHVYKCIGHAMCRPMYANHFKQRVFKELFKRFLAHEKKELNASRIKHTLGQDKVDRVNFLIVLENLKSHLLNK